MHINQYVKAQNKRIVHQDYASRKTTHILEDECRYLIQKLQKRSEIPMDEFILELHNPIKSFFIEMYLNQSDANVIEMELDMKQKKLSKLFVSWLLSFILTQKMLLGNLLEEDYNAIISPITLKRKFDIHFLQNYKAFEGICGNQLIEFLYFEISYPGFQNMQVCLESGLALYYFSKLHESYK